MKIKQESPDRSGLIVTLAAAFIAVPVAAQEPPVDLSGIWWSGAPLPLLPGESPAMGMGMGADPSVPLTDYAQELMADFDPADDPAVSCVQAGLVRQITSPYPIEVIQ